MKERRIPVSKSSFRFFLGTEGNEHLEVEKKKKGKRSDNITVVLVVAVGVLAAIFLIFFFTHSSHSRARQSTELGNMLSHNLLPFELYKSIVKEPKSSLSDNFFKNSYETMYGMFLMPIAHQFANNKDRRTIKILQVGVTCEAALVLGTNGGLWQRIFGQSAEVWVVVDEECSPPTDNPRMLKTLKNSKEDLYEWISKTGGNFDIIVEADGAKKPANSIMNYFEVLFRHGLVTGGLYFIEGIASEIDDFHSEKTVGSTADILQSWIEQLMLPNKPLSKPKHGAFLLPKAVKWIFCQQEACVIAKCGEFHTERGRCNPFIP